MYHVELAHPASPGRNYFLLCVAGSLPYKHPFISDHTIPLFFFLFFLALSTLIIYIFITYQEDTNVHFLGGVFSGWVVHRSMMKRRLGMSRLTWIIKPCGNKLRQITLSTKDSKLSCLLLIITDLYYLSNSATQRIKQ